MSIEQKQNKAIRRLAERLGMTIHQSVLDRRIKGLMREYPLSSKNFTIEDWLSEVAFVRGARVVQRPEGNDSTFCAPPPGRLSNEELVVSICQLQRLDRPQILRLAAQLVSRGAVDVANLLALARRERADIVVGELARQALKVDPAHAVWRMLAEAFPCRRPLRSPLLHWQRLAWPVMGRGGFNAERWELVK